MKKKSSLIIVIFLFALFAAACTQSATTTVPFNLNTLSPQFSPPTATLITDVTAYKEYLADASIFSPDRSVEFENINQKYTDTFFENNDLIAIIIQAPSTDICGYKISKPIDNSTSWEIKCIPLSKTKQANAQMGGYFCYYIEVPQKEGVTDAKLVSY